jgi:hypothetical protein
LTVKQIIILSVSLLAAAVILLKIAGVLRTGREFKREACRLRLYIRPRFIVSVLLVLAALIALLWALTRDYLSASGITAVILLCGVYLYIRHRSGRGLTESGVYVSGSKIPWDRIYDYYMDKTDGKIIFSSHLKGGLTLKGLTSPQFYNKEDEETIAAFVEQRRVQAPGKVVIR